MYKKPEPHLNLLDLVLADKVLSGILHEAGKEEAALVAVVELLPLGLQEAPGHVAASHGARHTADHKHSVLGANFVLQNIKTFPC